MDNANLPAALAAAELAADPVKVRRRGSEAMAQHHYYHRYDRAAVVAITVLQMLLDVDEFDRDELQIRLETLLREEFADIGRQLAADLGAQS